MRHVLTTALLLCADFAPVYAEPPEKNQATFESARPDNWSVNFGSWEAVKGVLVARQLPADNHAAASRWKIPLADGTVKFRLKFAGATAFHVGFDPAPGTLDKQGHLYSLVVTPEKAELRKHKDKAKPESKDQILATAAFPLSENRWMTVGLETEGDKVTATLDNGAGTVLKLTAADPTFHVPKPTVVFRVIGDAVQLDDVHVSVVRAK